MRIPYYLLSLSSFIFYALVFICLVSIFFVHYFVSGQAVYGDGIGYYAHLHDWTFDNEWNYTNEYKHIYSPENNNLVAPQSVDDVQIVSVTSSGRAANHFFPGTAVLILPYYLLADAVSQILATGGVQLARNGYSDIYQLFTGVGSIIYLIVGLHLLEKIVLFYCKDKAVARISAIAILLSTPLLYYGSYDVINSHAISFFLSSLFFYILLTKNKISILMLAVSVGAAIMTRVQDAGLVGVFILQNFIQVLTKKKQLSEIGKKILVFLVIVILVMLPLYLYWLETFGSFTQHTYIQAFLKERNTSSDINLLGSLFDTKNGLFIKSPLLFVLLGWYVYQCWKEKKFLYWQLAIFFIFQYLVISLQGGWKAAAYGGRMYISSLPFFAVLLGSMIKHTPQKDRIKLIIVVVFAICITFTTILTFVLVAKEAEQGNSGLENRTKERIQQLFIFK